MFQDHVSNDEMSLQFYVKIQGLPYVFLSSSVPIDHSGTTWPDLTGYTTIPNSLDASDIQDIGCNVSRIDGSASPASMSIRLLETRSYQLGDVFAWDKETGNLANLTASFPYNVGAGPFTMTVDDTTGWPASGVIHLGREAMLYDSITATSFNVTHRAQFDPVGHGDTVHRQNSNLPSASRVAADHPRVFIGRYVQVIAYWVTQDGYAIDSAYDGSNSFECFRGIIKELPRPGNDWNSFEFEIEAIDSILKTKCGIEARQAQLVNSPRALLPGYGSDDGLLQQRYFLVSGNSNKFHIKVTDSSGTVVLDATGQDAINVLGADTVPPTASVLMNVQFFNTFNENVNASLSAATSGVLSLDIKRSWNTGTYHFRASATSGSFTLDIDHDGLNSATKLLGMTGQVSEKISGGKRFNFTPRDKACAAYVDATSTVIPFTFVEDANLLTDIAPAEPGFAVIGDDDEAEIVSYSTITDLSSTAVKGLFQLNNVRRGLMGTAARTHALLADDHSENQGADIRFGLGVEDDSFLLTILNLAQSTGDGNHGSFYLFGITVGAPQAPGHFDDASFSETAAELTPTEQTISYFLSKPEALSDLAKDWLTPIGRFIFPRIDSEGAYTIGIGRNKPAIPSQSKITLTTTQLDWSNPATYQRGTNSIVTGVTVFPVWDFAEEESNDDVKVSVINHDAESAFGQRNIIEWKLRGYVISPGQALDLVKNWSAQLAERHGRGRVVLELQAGRQAWFVNVGDTVALTVPEIPTPDGGRGLTLRYGVVENIVKIFSGETIGCVLRVVVESGALIGAFRPYAPSAKVSSKSSSTVTLAANEYTESSNDAAFFSVGDNVVIHNEGDYSTREQKTITAISGNDITLNSAVSLTVGSHTAMDYDIHANVTANQKLAAAYVSDSAHSLSNGDDGHRYT